MMKRRFNVASLLALLPAVFLLIFIPVATQSGVPDFWKGFLEGSALIFMIGFVALAIVQSRSSDKDKAP